jgi:hypothetical protein
MASAMLDELDILKLVAARLEAAGVPCMVSGSMAINYYAQPRMTRDIDVVVELGAADGDHVAALFAPDFLCEHTRGQQTPDGRCEERRGRRVCDHRVLHRRSHRRSRDMGKVKVWFDEEGDFLEVTFARRKGTLREVGPDVYERVDGKGQVIGFAVFNFSKRDRKTVEIPLDLAQVAAGH